MVMRGGCGILLSVGFAVSLGHRKFSDLDLSNVLVRPSLILHCSGYTIVEPLDGFYSVAVPAAPAVFAQHELLQVPLGCCTTFLAASAFPALALEAWVGQPPFPLHSQCLSCAGWLADDDCWVPHPVRLPFVGCYWLFLRVVMPKRL